MRIVGENSVEVNPVVNELNEQINSSFLVYRTLISNELAANGPAANPEQYVDELQQKFKQYWYELFNGPIRMGMGKDNAFTEAAAGRYSDELADQINSVSNRAFLEAYNASLNKGTDRAVAWKRIADAWGLDPAQMRAWVMSYPEGGYQTEAIPNRDRLNKMLQQRADRISGHESWTIHQLGKQADWITSDSYKTAKKVWRTAHDELVCPTCAPMDGITIGVGERFVTGLGNFFAPPIHINCRCDVELISENLITKAQAAQSYDEYKRDQKGRFASVNSARPRALDFPEETWEEHPQDYLQSLQTTKPKHANKADKKPKIKPKERIAPPPNEVIDYTGEADLVLDSADVFNALASQSIEDWYKVLEVGGVVELESLGARFSTPTTRENAAISREDDFIFQIYGEEGSPITSQITEVEGGTFEVVEVKEMNPSDIDRWAEINNTTHSEQGSINQPGTTTTVITLVRKDKV